MTKESIGVVKWFYVSEIYIDILVSFMVNLINFICQTYDILQVGKARNDGFIFPKNCNDHLNHFMRRQTGIRN